MKPTRLLRILPEMLLIALIKKFLENFQFRSLLVCNLEGNKNYNRPAATNIFPKQP